MKHRKFAAHVTAAMAGGAALLLTIHAGSTSNSSSNMPSISGSTSNTRSRFSPSAHATIQYVTSWSWDGAREDGATGARSFTTDFGTEVTIIAGYVGVMSIELVPCETADGNAAIIHDQALFSVDFASAYANHGRVHDASLRESTFADSMIGSHADAPRPFGEASTSGLSYCSAHALVAPVDETADDGFQLAHASVYLRGTYRLVGERESHAFVAHSTIADGAIVPIDALYKTGNIRIDITRHPARAFDGIHFERASATSLAYAFLRKLDGATTLSVTTRDQP